MTLFRPEVAAAQSAQWLGCVRLHRPLSFTLVTTAALGMALMLVADDTAARVAQQNEPRLLIRCFHMLLSFTGCPSSRIQDAICL